MVAWSTVVRMGWREVVEICINIWRGKAEGSADGSGCKMWGEKGKASKKLDCYYNVSTAKETILNSFVHGCVLST